MKIKKLQTGGEMMPPAEEAMMAEQGMEGAAAEQAPVGDPMQEVVGILAELGQLAEQALQAQDPAAMAEVCQAVVEIAGQLAGGAQEEVPMFKKGTGKMIKKKKCAKGGKMKKC